MPMAVALREIAAQLGGELIGDAELRDRRASRRWTARRPTRSRFLANPRYRAQLAGTPAGCVIVAPALRDAAAARGAAHRHADDPYLYFARLTQWWARATRAAPRRRPPERVVDPSARRSTPRRPLAVIEAGAVIGDGA